MLIPILTVMIRIGDTDAISDTDAIRDISAADDNNAINNTNATVSCHNFKSQKIKLSVSNPKNKYVAYLSVLSRISNCQSLGRKNKFEILKTYRNDNNNNHDDNHQCYIILYYKSVRCCFEQFPEHLNP